MRKIISIIVIGLIVVIGAGFAVREVVFPIKDKDIIEKYAKEYNVEPELVASIINFETRFEPVKNTGKNGAGLMKLTADTGEKIAKEMGDTNFNKDDIDKDDTNIKLGTYYISKNGGENLSDLVGNWAIRNGENKEDKFDDKQYAKDNYTKKIETRKDIYKVLYFLF
ncbi:transglycosylase SLT domain-containing protein [Clostridium sp.]|uniref:transglycosylase SLT domain-containing protein n=1 Tax=Clostridium sp. TaxID=1506 RepID=UPI002FC5FDF7